MGRMSKEQYERYMEYVSSGGDKSYRVPPGKSEIPWEYLSAGDKIAAYFWKGIYYSIIFGLCFLIGTCAYKHYRNKKPLQRTPITRSYDRHQDFRRTNQQTKTQSLEEKVKTNLIKWCREKGHSTHLISIYDCEIVWKYAWVACYLGRASITSLIFP